MSFILDALKKSDAERQRTSTPGFADIPDAREPSRTPRWMWAVGALLAVNLIVLVVILLRHDAAPERTESIAQSIALPDTAAEITFSDLVAEAKEERRAAEAEPPPPAPERAEPRDSAAPPVREPAKEPAREPEASRGTITTALTTFNELRADGALQLPNLHLDLHVYSNTPADRFIMINMSKYTEGEALTEGPLVKEITPLGVILEHEGTAFLLPRR